MQEYSNNFPKLYYFLFINNVLCGFSSSFLFDLIMALNDFCKKQMKLGFDAELLN